MLVIMIAHQSLSKSFPRYEGKDQLVFVFCVLSLSLRSSLKSILFCCLAGLCWCFAWRIGMRMALGSAFDLNHSSPVPDIASVFVFQCLVSVCVFRMPCVWLCLCFDSWQSPAGSL